MRTLGGSTTVQQLQRGVETAPIKTIDTYRSTVWRVAGGAFGIGAIAGAGISWLSRILW
jgi:hypothetical protein